MKSVSLLRERLLLLPKPNKTSLCPMISILFISFTAAIISMLLSHENVDGRPVPVLFRDRPTYYHMFLISTMFAFLGAFSALLLQHKPRFERFCRIIAVASMLSALAIVLYAAAFCFYGQLLNQVK
ncbi:btb/poz and math domain-containing protein 2 [Fagus crenata]